MNARASTMGVHGDVVEAGNRGFLILRAGEQGPPRKLLDSLIVSGTLVRLKPAA